MALILCPDCKKQISSRVGACPFCGCPAEYFDMTTEMVADEETSEIIIEKTKTYNSDDNDTDVYEEKIDETAEVDLSALNNSIEFDFDGYIIKYPANSTRFAGLFGDYVKLGLENMNKLYNVYNSLGDIDAVMHNLCDVAQSMIDDQIQIVIKDLYNRGLSTTDKLFKKKHSDLPLLFEPYMSSLIDKYNEIYELQSNLTRKRNINYSNRGRWVGGGFGMKGAIKGAFQAAVLNAGESAISGIGKSMATSKDNARITKMKEKLFKDEELKKATCYGMLECINGLFVAYTDELYVLGQLGERINIDAEAANTKYEASLLYEDNGEKIYATMVECLSLLPSGVDFYEMVEMRLTQSEAWKEFKDFWHLNFLYHEENAPIMASRAKYNSSIGRLRLSKYKLVFESGDIKTISVSSITKVEFDEKDIILSVRGRILPEYIETNCNELWSRAIKQVISGDATPISIEEIEKAQSESYAKKQNEEEAKKRIREYIKNNYSLYQYNEAVDYYNDQTGDGKMISKLEVDDVFREKRREATKKSIKKETLSYPGMERLKEGYYKNEKVEMIMGDGNPLYIIISKGEVIEIDIKKRVEKRYDIFMMSKFVKNLFGMSVNCKYKDGFIAKTISFATYEETASGRHRGMADEAIDLILNLQKGNYFMAPRIAESLLVEDDDELCDSSYVTEKSNGNTEKIVALIKCSKCGREIKETNKFCNYCGTINIQDEKMCPQCGKAIRSGIKFCNFCGCDLRDSIIMQSE